MAYIDISGFAPNSITDGPGLRFSVFCQGCIHHCHGCHNPETHEFGIGTKYDVEDIYKMIKKDPIVRGVTFSGGEPFCQREGFYELAKLLKADGYEIAAYSGFTYEQLTKDTESMEYKLLQLCDVLIDGRFELDKRSLSAGFRGSTNQRVLNVKNSLAAGEAVWEISARWQTLNQA
ncbi:MAG: anaerobic ribonucleoside-triphosphate reductase activating protein [Oscillospiraceae bacterium]|nr:anaerobic ribonucleoside-triphosphate reductase activating protein [Oscillospiraceae bacterium]